MRTVGIAEHRLCRLCDLTVGQPFEPPRPRLVVDGDGPRGSPASVADPLVLVLALSKLAVTLAMSADVSVGLGGQEHMLATSPWCAAQVAPPRGWA